MAVKIEDVPMLDAMSKPDAQWNDFLVGMRDLNVGQSFLVPAMPSNYRLVMSAAQVLMGRRYMSRKEAAGHRIGRVL